MKKILFFLTLLVLSGFSVQAAQNKTGAQNGSGEGTGGQIQNQNQVQTQNKGEEQQLQMQFREQEQVGASQGGGINSQNRSQNTEEHMSVVAEKVQELQQMRGGGGLGEQVRQIAQQQSTAQDTIKQNVDKLNSRSDLKKFILGSDYTAIKNLKNQLTANQLRITQLEELKTQLINQDEAIIIQSTIETLIQQNTIVENQIKTEEGTISMFGWLFRLFVK